MTKKIAVIGGGASAALLLAHLVQKDADVAVDVYDRTGRFARGVAYSTPHECHLLNVRAANMSAYQDDKDHFAHWAASRGYTASDFVPRKLYGDYLAERLDEARKRLNVHLLQEDVLSCKQNSLQTTGGQRDYDGVVLASGNVRSLAPCVVGDVKDYYPDPWSVNITAIKNYKTIALVGSGLTAVDIVLALQTQHYKGKILIFSRNALLPAPHVDPVPFESFLSKADEHLSPLVLLRMIRRTAKTSDVPWQSVIDSLRAHTNPIWQNWNEEQRAQFNKRLLTFWNVHRHRMAPQIAAVVEDLRQAGRLAMVKAGVNAIKHGPVVDSAAGDFKIDAVINCLGYRYNEIGRVYEGCERLGPARFGELFETTAIPEIRAQAFDLANKLTQ